MTRFLQILAGLAVVALLVFFAMRWDGRMKDGLPPQTVCESQVAAYGAALDFALTLVPDQDEARKLIVPVLGTGSMRPYIPAAPIGADPRSTVVAYFVRQPRATIADVREGSLVSYRADWLPSSDYAVAHQAAQFRNGGWIMSGLGNAHYETRWRVTERNFIGITVATFVWPSSP